MPATATAMVKAIWRSYFQIQGSGADAEADGEGDAPVAKAVEEVRHKYCMLCTGVLTGWVPAPQHDVP